MGTTIEQVAAHEAGHAIVGLAVGRKLLNISMMQGQHPEAQFTNTPDVSFITEFTPTTKQIEGRLTYLAAAAGMAGEVVLEGAFHTPGAEDDLSRLREVKLNDTQIQGLTNIAVKIITANLTLWQKVSRRALSGIERGQPTLVEGAGVNALFKEVGKKFTDFSELDQLLPP
jgi:hypothetical protein